VAIGTVIDPVPVTGLPSLGREMDGAEIWKLSFAPDSDGELGVELNCGFEFAG
jgi:hypothetical protein